jgi:hypothetical protein
MIATGYCGTCKKHRFYEVEEIRRIRYPNGKKSWIPFCSVSCLFDFTLRRKATVIDSIGKVGLLGDSTDKTIGQKGDEK